MCAWIYSILICGKRAAREREIRTKYEIIVVSVFCRIFQVHVNRKCSYARFHFHSHTAHTRARSYVHANIRLYFILLYVRNECYEYKRSSTHKNYRWTNVMNSNMTQSPKTRQPEKNASKYVCMNVQIHTQKTYIYTQTGLSVKSVGWLPVAHVVSHSPFVTIFYFLWTCACVCQWHPKYTFVC